MEKAPARATIALGCAALLSTLFVFTRGLPEYLDFVDLRLPGAVLLGILGLVAVIGGVRRIGALALLTGLGLGVLAVSQLVMLALKDNVLGGDASTVALAGGLGIGLLCAWWADRNAAASVE